MLTINHSIKSPNFEARPNGTAISYVIIHYTEIPCDEAIQRLCNPELKVSCHYLINEEGVIYSLVDDRFKAWHAGKSYWRGGEKLNDYSIGIELVNSGKEPFTEQLIASLINLCTYLQNIHPIHRQNFIGHSDIAPDRKIDPGVFFPWQILFNAGFGIYPSISPNISAEQALYKFGDRGENISILQQRLRILGYNIEVTKEFDKQTSDVIRAFQSHFLPDLILKNGTIDDFFNLNMTYTWTINSQHILKDLIEAYK